MRYAISDELAQKLISLLRSSKDTDVHKLYLRLQNRLDILEFERLKLHDRQTREQAGKALQAHIESIANEADSPNSTSESEN